MITRFFLVMGLPIKPLIIALIFVEMNLRKDGEAPRSALKHEIDGDKALKQGDRKLQAGEWALLVCPNS